MDDSEPRTEAEVVRAGVTSLASRLPSHWRLTVSEQATIAQDADYDALVLVVSPNGESVTLVVEAKRSLESVRVSEVANQLKRAMKARPQSVGVVMSKYLSPPVRARIVDAGLSYADATGNVYLEVSNPGLFISADGATKDPWRGPGRPRGTLKGRPAAHVVRALLDFDGEWRMRELIDVSKTSTGAAYRVVDFLEAEDLVTKSASGSVRVTDWVKLLRRWSRDFSFVENSRVSRWIAPRGLSALLERAAASTELDYAVTGTLAAAEWAPYAPARLGMVYVRDADVVADRWGLRRADGGANVILAEPEVDVPFVRPRHANGVKIAAPTQVAVDLMTGPGRNPSEAEALIDWMVSHESSWRS